jgi:Tfp pilus assembly protein PilV
MFREIIDLEAPGLTSANKAYEDYISQVVEPMKDSVIGRLAGRKGSVDGVEAATTKLFKVFNKGTLPGSNVSEILTLERTFRQAGRPEEYQNAVKTWMVDKLDSVIRSSKDNRAPDNMASQLKVLFGNPREATSTTKGLEDMLVGLARSQGVEDQAAYLKGFRQFMEYTTEAARRPSSVTGMSAADVTETAGQAATNRLGRFSVMTPIRQPALAWSSLLQNDALKTLDELLTSSQGVETLIKLGKSQPYSQAAITAMATFLGTNAAAQSQYNADGLPENNTPEN